MGDILLDMSDPFLPEGLYLVETLEGYAIEPSAQYTPELYYVQPRAEHVPPPHLSTQRMFGLGYDVIFLILAYTFAISIAVRMFREVTSYVAQREPRFTVVNDICEMRYVLPMFIGGISGLYVWDVIAVLSGYQGMETSAAIYLGISAGALSSWLNETVFKFLSRYNPAQTGKYRTVSVDLPGADRYQRRGHHPKRRENETETPSERSSD